MLPMTRGEQRFILFVLAAFFIGLGVDAIKKPLPRATADDDAFKRAALLPAGKKTIIISRVNVNRADKVELSTLPGIGPVTAQRIIDFREAYGPFTRLEDIVKVERIGPKTFEKIKNFITLK